MKQPDEYIVPEKYNENIRLDKYIASVFKEYSRTRIQRWIKSSLVSVNDKPVSVNYMPRAGDNIKIKVPETARVELTAENIPLNIIYEDDDLLVVNKPAGVVTHPGVGHPSGTLLNAVLYHVRGMASVGDRARPGLIHRLDKDTSGLIMFAKNDTAHLKMTTDLKDRKISRTYRAVASGVIPHDRGTCNAPIGRSERDRKKMIVTDKNSRHAVTHFRCLEVFRNFTYLEINLETGRTHQIRVHMKYIGHPVAGDRVYGRKTHPKITRPALHAFQLKFGHPKTGKTILCESPLPEDFELFLDYLRKHDK